MGAWLFHVASSPAAGGGHVARCLVLGDALRARGEAVTFSLDADGRSWGDRLDELDFQWRTDGDQLGDGWDGCLVDGYRIPLLDWERLRRSTGLLASIVDDQPIPDFIDLVIAPAGYNAKRLDGVCYACGLAYTPVDPAFTRRAAAAPRDGVRSLLVSFGRRDSANVTSLALDALGQLRAGGFAPDIAVAIGRDAPHLEAVRSKLAHLPGSRLYVDAPLIDLMPDFDLAIGAGGVSLAERCAAGIPSITITIAANQEAQADLVAAGGGTVLLGDAASITAEGMAAAVRGLSLDHSARRLMAEAARKLVDGRGAERVAGIMTELQQHRKLS